MWCRKCRFGSPGILTFIRCPQCFHVHTPEAPAHERSPFPESPIKKGRGPAYTTKRGKHRHGGPGA